MHVMHLHSCVDLLQMVMGCLAFLAGIQTIKLATHIPMWEKSLFVSQSCQLVHGFLAALSVLRSY